MTLAISIPPTARIVETAGAKYELSHVVSYDLATDVLHFVVHCHAPYERTYECTWARGELGLVGHCELGSEAPLSKDELPVNEAYDLMRWCESGEQVSSERAAWLLEAIAEG